MHTFSLPAVFISDGNANFFFLYLLFVFVFSAMLQDSCEFNEIEQAIFDRRLAIHLIDVLVGEAVAHCGEQLAQTLLRDQAHVLLVKAAECIFDHVLGIGALQPLAEQRQEHGEIDGARRLVHHPLQILVGRAFAQRRQHIVQVLLLDEAVAVLVDHVEGLFEFGDLRLIEHGEHIGGGALGTLFGGRAAAGCFA